jgi:hypothetical protein
MMFRATRVFHPRAEEKPRDVCSSQTFHVLGQLCKIMVFVTLGNRCPIDIASGNLVSQEGLVKNPLRANLGLSDKCKYWCC